MDGFPKMPALSVKQVIIEPEPEDEEPLIQPVPTARRVRRAQHEQAQFLMASVEKPPACGFCFNTRCGAYFVAALQISYGLLQLMACLAFLNFQEIDLEDAGDLDSQSQRQLLYTDYRVLWTGFVATFAVVSGILTFHRHSWLQQEKLKKNFFSPFFFCVGVFFLLSASYVMG